MANDLPAHTRGFLFSDLRGYSAFTERHGDQAARKLLTSYRQSVREVIGKFDGAEIRTEGDSFYVVFDSVSQAVRAGLAILAAVAEPSADAAAHPVLVGIGIHAGETEDSAEGIVSSAVKRCGPHLRTGRTRGAAGQRYRPRPNAQLPRG